LDVHPPHKPIHSWRDFLVQLITITVGLLIALSLEAAVEWSHHRHLVHQARVTIHGEMEDNRKLLAEDLTSIQEDRTRIQTDIDKLVELRRGKKFEHSGLQYHMYWSSFADSAWRTAQATGALNFMDYATVQALSEVYEQQTIVSNSGITIFNQQNLAIAPVFITGDPNLMSPEEIQLTLQRSADLLLGVKALEELLTQLDARFDRQLKQQQQQGF